LSRALRGVRSAPGGEHSSGGEFAA
jgi:hypothetical protein